MAATGFEVTLEMLEYRYRLDACYPITRTKLGSDTNIIGLSLVLRFISWILGLHLYLDFWNDYRTSLLSLECYLESSVWNVELGLNFNYGFLQQ